MSGVNKVLLIGNLVRDPEMRNVQNGSAVANFTVATSENWKDKATGQKKEKSEFHKVVAFNRLAEICGQYLHKGSKVYIEGSLRTSEWEKDGVKRYSTEIIAKEMKILDSRNSGDNQQQSQPQHQQSHKQPFSVKNNPPPTESQSSAEPPPPDFGDFDDDIPF